MKIAVPTRGSQVDDHFGHCEKFSVFTINDKREITNTEIVPSPEGCGCKSNIASVLKEKGVEVMLAGNMGDGAVNVLKSQNIAVLRGNHGNILTLVESYLKGFIFDSGINCKQHEGHECGHNHADEHSCQH
jgi:predicted Fe-Mo cluster-binding NifX family protein